MWHVSRNLQTAAITNKVSLHRRHSHLLLCTSHPTLPLLLLPFPISFYPLFIDLAPPPCHSELCVSPTFLSCLRLWQTIRVFLTVITWPSGLYLFLPDWRCSWNLHQPAINYRSARQEGEEMTETSPWIMNTAWEEREGVHQRKQSQITTLNVHFSLRVSALK